MESISFSFSSQVEQLQLDSMIMSEDGSRENTSGSLPTEFKDMDAAEKVNEEQLDLTVYSSSNSKKLFASWYSAVGNNSYIDFQTKIEGDREGRIILTAYIKKTAVDSNNHVIIINVADGVEHDCAHQIFYVQYIK